MSERSAVISLAEGARRLAAAANPAQFAALSAAQKVLTRPDLPGRRLPFSEALNAFVRELRTQERSPTTIEGYEYELTRFERWFTEEAIDWQIITRQEMSAYARTREHLAFSSKASLMVTMRQFYAWAEREELVILSPAAHLQTPKRPAPVPKALTADQVRRLLQHLEAHVTDGLRARRDQVMICTALYAGMRAAELAGAIWEHFDLNGQIITIPISKMARGRTLKMHPDLVPMLATWRDAQGADGAESAPVFSLDRAQRLVPNRVGKIARMYADLLTLPLTAHTLRHTFATWSLRKSGNLYAVSKALGHKHLTQTEVYLRSDPADSAPAVDALPSPTSW